MWNNRKAVGMAFGAVMLMLSLMSMPQAYSCLFTNTTVNAMCNAFNTNMTALQTNSTMQSNSIASLSANQLSMYQYSLAQDNSIAMLSANQLTQSTALATTQANVVALGATIASINSNSTTAMNLASTASANAILANTNAAFALTKVNATSLQINNLSQYTPQRINALNANISTIRSFTDQISNANIIATYPSVQSSSTSGGDLAGIALIIAILEGGFILFHHFKVDHKHNPQSQKVQTEEVVGKVVNAEQAAKQSKTIEDETKAKTLIEMRAKAEREAKEGKAKAEADKKAEMEKNEKYIAALEKFRKTVNTIKRQKELLGEELTEEEIKNLPATKKLVEIMKEYDQPILW